MTKINKISVFAIIVTLGCVLFFKQPQKPVTTKSYKTTYEHIKADQSLEHTYQEKAEQNTIGNIANTVKTPTSQSQVKKYKAVIAKQTKIIKHGPQDNRISSIHYQLSEKQKENLASESEITSKGWLIKPYDKVDVDGNPNPILKYVPHLDNQGNFHSVSIFDFDLNVGQQIAYAYPIPYTSEFPPVTVKQAKEIFLKRWDDDRYEISNTGKLVWMAGDRYTPYRLYTCKTKQKEKVYKRDGREIKVLLPREVTNQHCLMNMYSGHIRWGKRL